MIFLLLYTHFSRKESFLYKININYHVYTALTQLCSPPVIRKSVSGTQKMILGWQPVHSTQYTEYTVHSTHRQYTQYTAVHSSTQQSTQHRTQYTESAQREWLPS